jgi:hypothetical protein
VFLKIVPASAGHVAFKVGHSVALRVMAHD